tara:strand:+ start:210 stop:473 length:264 start_codon:yes stop_codon:yes gene_type:complete
MEDLVNNSTTILQEDGCYYTMEQIKEALPFADEAMQKILYLQLNDKLLSEEEKNAKKLELDRMIKSRTIRMKPDLEQLKTNSVNQLE